MVSVSSDQLLVQILALQQGTSLDLVLGVQSRVTLVKTQVGQFIPKAHDNTLWLCAAPAFLTVLASSKTSPDVPFYTHDPALMPCIVILSVHP